MTLIAAQAIDFAIFGSLGALWVAGAFVIYFVWSWVIRYEAENPDIVNRPPVPEPRRGATAADSVRLRAPQSADAPTVAAAESIAAT